jgi:RND family efflux transporter MFP subunit
MVAVALTTVAILVMIAWRASQAVAKRAQLSAERDLAQAGAVQKPVVVVTNPKPATLKPRVELTGTLRPWREADIGFETMGRLARVSVVTGQSVKVGQSLGVLDGQRAGEIQAIKSASVRAAEAGLALAEDGAKRSEALAATKSLPEAQAEQARQQFALAKAQLEAARGDAQLARTGAGLNVLSAPFAGIVTRAPSAGGAVVQPGAPLFRVEDLTRLRLTASVSEDDAALIKVGQRVTIRYRDREVFGKVSTLVPSLDPMTRRAPVEIEVPNQQGEPLLGYGFVRAVIEVGVEVPVVRVPATARRPGSQDEVVKVEGGKVAVARVTFTADDDGSWLVRGGGLTVSDVIMLTPSAEVKNGDLVERTELR